MSLPLLDNLVRVGQLTWVEQEEKRLRLTLEGLADIDAGRTIDQAEVDAWVQSLDSDKPLPLPQCG